MRGSMVCQTDGTGDLIGKDLVLDRIILIR
jgi:hypothetical protein